LNLTVVYEDSPTRQWALEVHETVTKLAGPESVRATWWKVSNLRLPGVLAGAVSTAMRADVIVVSIRAVEGLPLPFYVWVKGWLPHRLTPTGALVLLLPAPQEPGSRSSRVAEFLRETARQGRLDFLVREQQNLSNSRQEMVSQLTRGSLGLRV
jgi:hypothetical protein